MGIRGLTLCGLTLALICPVPAEAQNVQMWEQCESGGEIPIERVIAACTSVIADSSYSHMFSDEIADAFYARGLAYEESGDLANAQRDFLGALKRRPKMVTA